MKVAHLTSVHARTDARIFLKECRSLARSGYDTTLVVADGLGTDLRDGVGIVDVGRPPNRISRLLTTSRRVIRSAIELDADVYHIHDPELLPGALRLKWRGKRVIFDAHEDLPLQTLAKSYLWPPVRKSVAAAAGLLQREVCRRIDCVVAATPSIRDKFAAMGIRSVDVRNFPLLDELQPVGDWQRKGREVCYLGGISAGRGVREMVLACEHLQSDVRLNLAGRFTEPAFEKELTTLAGWTRVNKLGFLDRNGVREVTERSLAGLVTLRPTPNHIESLPVKMFEYMAAGIPVVASNFPLWKEIVEASDCGICVDPLDPRQIASAIDRLVSDAGLAERMGENGRRAALERYNWDIEEKKLLDCYQHLVQ